MSSDNATLALHRLYTTGNCVRPITVRLRRKTCYARPIWLPILLLTAALLLALVRSQAPAAPEEAAEAGRSGCTAEEGPCAPATEGELAGIDPRGQNIIWWHNHSGSREEKLLAAA